jgi:hypothetical protein
MSFWTLAAAWWRLQTDALTLAIHAPVVVAHRLAKAGTSWHEPGFVADPEWRRMVSEKVEAAVESHHHAARWWLEAVDHPFDLERGLAATRRTLGPYARRVTRNADRLSG